MKSAFNSDLLLNEPDRAEAARRFPDIYFAIDNPELRAVFAPIDARANLAKSRSRQAGVFAVLLATFALLVAGGEMLLHDLPKHILRVIAAVGGVAGVVSVLIGVFGVMYKKRKLRWLADRLITERLRQFHFQSIASGAADIVRGVRDPAAAEAYVARRREKFDAFQKSLVHGAEAELHRLVHSPIDIDGDIFKPGRTDIDPADSAFQALLTGYKALRFDRQLGYCEHVLRNEGGLWSRAPVRQAKVLSTTALMCVMGILALHGLVFIGAVADIGWMKGALVHVIAIWFAIIALSARTFEEGFQPEREIERMRQYRFSVKRLLARFETSTDADDKIAAMLDMEKLAYEEMLLFLKSNHEAEFVM